MFKYIFLRTLLIIPILIAVTFITFSILNFSPGNPGLIILGMTAPKEDIDRLNHELGVDRPFFERFIKYLWGIFTRFDFGKSYRTRKPVAKEIIQRFPYTLRLAFLSVLGSSAIGIPIGVMIAAKRNIVFDRALNIFAMVFASIPSFVFALTLILVFSNKLKWFPSYGASTWQHYVLPLATLILPASVGKMRLARLTMLESIRQDYVTMARSKGIPESRVIFVHALKNSMIPLITSILMSFSGMLGGAIIIETIFAFPGLGMYMVQGIQMKDVPTTLACAIFLAAIFSLTVLVLDIIYVWIDPRIKNRFVSAVK